MLTIQAQLQLLVWANDEDSPDGQGQVGVVLVGRIQHAVCTQIRPCSWARCEQDAIAEKLSAMRESKRAQ